MEHQSINTNSKAVFTLINWSKFSSFHRLFVLSFENNTHQKRHTVCFLSKVEIESYNKVNFFFEQPVNNDARTHENVKNIATDQGDDYTGC